MSKLGPPDEPRPAETMEEWNPAPPEPLGSAEYNEAVGQRVADPVHPGFTTEEPKSPGKPAKAAATPAPDEE